MKKNLALIALITITLGLSNTSCNNIAMKPSKNYITRNYNVDHGFDKLNISTVGDVYYTQSSDGNFTVSVYGPDNYVELIEVNIENNTLSINMPRLKPMNKVNKMKITISSPNLYALNFKGVGNINIKDGLKTDQFKIVTSGVGNMKIDNLICENIDIDSNGVGNVNIQGNSQNASINSRGVGDIHAFDLQAKEVDVLNSGVGNISCYASESITAKSRGVGNITYGGNPTIKNLSKGGVGSINSK